MNTFLPTLPTFSFGIPVSKLFRSFFFCLGDNKKKLLSDPCFAKEHVLLSVINILFLELMRFVSDKKEKEFIIPSSPLPPLNTSLAADFAAKRTQAND